VAAGCLQASTKAMEETLHEAGPAAGVAASGPANGIGRTDVMTRPSRISAGPRPSGNMTVSGLVNGCVNHACPPHDVQPTCSGTATLTSRVAYRKDVTGRRWKFVDIGRSGNAFGLMAGHGETELLERRCDQRAASWRDEGVVGLDIHPSWLEESAKSPQEQARTELDAVAVG
jgi:hypothetical protein